MRKWLSMLAPVAMGALVGVVGCRSKTLTSGHDAGVSGFDGGAAARDAAPNLLDAAPDLLSVGRGVTGTFVAPGVNAAISFPGGAVFLAPTGPPGQPTGGLPVQSFYRFVFAGPGPGYLNATLVMKTSQEAFQVTFDSPAGIVIGSTNFYLELTIGAAVTGEVTSASGCTSGSMILEGALPAYADANCEKANDAGICPSGCSRAPRDGGGYLCELAIPSIWYTDPEPKGDWTLSVAEVDSNFDGGSALAGLYPVHGTLVAHLVGGLVNTADGVDAGQNTGTLRLDF